MSDLQQIIPRPAGEIVKPYQTPDQHWEEVTAWIYGAAALPENVAFDRDPRWDRKFWSIQNAHNQGDGKSFGFWSVIGFLFLTADVGGYGWMRWI